MSLQVFQECSVGAHLHIIRIQSDVGFIQLTKLFIDSWGAFPFLIRCWVTENNETSELVWNFMWKFSQNLDEEVFIFGAWLPMDRPRFLQLPADSWMFDIIVIHSFVNSNKIDR